MSSKFLQVEIDDTRLHSLFQRLQEKGESFSEVTASIANHLYNITDEAFDAQRSFDGTPWERLSDSTIQAKGHDKKLYHTGAMRDSLSSTHSKTQAIVGLNAYKEGYPYPAVHQFGTQKIEARPYLPFTKEKRLFSKTEEDIITIVKRFLEEI